MKTDPVKIVLDGDKIKATLGRDLVITEGSVVLRYMDGKIVPVLTFTKPAEGLGRLSAKVQQRITEITGDLHAAPWGRRPVPVCLERDPTKAALAESVSRGQSFAAMNLLPRLPRL